MSSTVQPHKDNAPGPFYVCDGCCTACDIPFAEAADLFAYDDQNHCYLNKQPQTESELDRMIRTVLSAELECIRYRGTDKNILRRLAEAGTPYLSDTLVTGIAPSSHNHVTFDAVDPIDKLLLERDLVSEFQAYLRAQENDYLTYRFKALSSDGANANFSFAWFEDDFHAIEVSFIGLSEARWLVVTDVPFTVHDWLVAEKRFCNIRWYTVDQWNNSKEWQRTPW